MHRHDQAHVAEPAGLVVEQIPDLLDRLMRGPAIEPTAYDTAWVASLPDPQRADRPRFPSSLAWLIAHQNLDGSWGTSEDYAYDRLVCTLAGLATVLRFRAAAGAAGAAQRAEGYLARSTSPAQHAAGEPVGFELLIPALMARARDSGARVPGGLDRYSAIRAEKLALIPAARLYSNRLTTVHSLEFLGDSADPTRLRQARGRNGSVGNSPAATAFYVERCHDQAALDYLGARLHASDGTAAPVLHPCEQFEALWSLYHLRAAGLPLAEFVDPDFWRTIASWVGTSGVTLSSSFAIPDADDTAVALLLLGDAGLRTDATVLERFAREDLYVSFPSEQHSSVGVNAHVLQVIGRTPAYPDRARRTRLLLDYLRRARIEGTHWYDKWHLSPFYATAHVLLALRDVPRELRSEARVLARPALRWIEAHQADGGGWSAGVAPTAEETGYAVLGALAWPDELADAAGLAERAGGFLDEHGMAGGDPALWIDKCLYKPTRIVEAVVLGARCALAIFGERPDRAHRPPGRQAPIAAAAPQP